MGNTVSRGTLDVIYILFPFVLSAGLIIMIVVCWWKCKLFFNRRRPAKSRREDYPEESNFGHLINIQEYAENQVGTTIVYADSPGSACPHPYVYFSDGRITRIVPLTPSPTYSNVQHYDHSHSSCPSSLLCNNLSRTRNNNMRENHPCQNNSHHHNNFHGQTHLHPNNLQQQQISSEDSPANEVTTTTSASQIVKENEPDSEENMTTTTTIESPTNFDTCEAVEPKPIKTLIDNNLNPCSNITAEEGDEIASKTL